MKRVVDIVLVAGSFVVLSLPGFAFGQDGSPVGDPVAGKEKALDVCAACHGVNGDAIVPEYPDLAGQNAAYLVSALNAYKNKQRVGGDAGIMTPQAAGLSSQDIADLAAFYAGLGSEKPEPTPGVMEGR